MHPNIKVIQSLKSNNINNDDIAAIIITEISNNNSFRHGHRSDNFILMIELIFFNCIIAKTIIEKTVRSLGR